MKFADVHKYWVRKKPEKDEKPTISPLIIAEGDRLSVQYDYVHMGKQPPLGFVVGEFWWDENGLLQMDIWPIFDEIRKEYGL